MQDKILYLFIYLEFYVSFKTVQVISRRVVGRAKGNQYIQLAKVLYCKLPTNGKQLPAFPLEVGLGTKPQPQRWEVRVLQNQDHTMMLHTYNLQPVSLSSINFLHLTVSGI